MRCYVYYAIPTFSPSTVVSGQSKKAKKKLQILLGGTKVFDYVLICFKKIKALISIEENINWKFD